MKAWGLGFRIFGVGLGFGVQDIAGFGAGDHGRILGFVVQNLSLAFLIA